MIDTFLSKQSSPRARGEEFGARFAAKIAENIQIYQRLFLLPATQTIDEIHSFANQAFLRVQSFSQDIASEIEGMALGANVALSDLMALNARTELLAVCGVFTTPECSVAISLGDDSENSVPIAVQTWDWLTDLSDGWLLWTIEASDGHVVNMLTEYGIVGKIGVNSRGVGVLLNILAHERDGRLPVGLPVHVAARSILDERADLHNAIARVTSSPLSASSSLSVIANSTVGATAFSLELFPGGPGFHLPNEAGILVHTNHFLSLVGAIGDRAPKFGSSSFSRYEQLRRRLAVLETVQIPDVLKIMSSHVGGAHSICSHPVPDARFGEKSETLAVVQLHVDSGQLSARKGGPCASGPWTSIGLDSL